MRIPADATIAADKLTRYLLVARPWDDKARFLARAGFTLDDPDALAAAIRRLTAGAEAIEDSENDYGVFLRVEGQLVGPAGRLAVVLIWMRRHVDGSVHFVTLKPLKEKRL